MCTIIINSLKIKKQQLVSDPLPLLLLLLLEFLITAIFFITKYLHILNPDTIKSLLWSVFSVSELFIELLSVYLRIFFNPVM